MARLFRRASQVQIERGGHGRTARAESKLLCPTARRAVGPRERFPSWQPRDWENYDGSVTNGLSVRAHLDGQARFNGLLAEAVSAGTEAQRDSVQAASAAELLPLEQEGP
jgi:hypothetical protein